MSKLNIWDILNVGAALANAAREDAEVKEVRQSDEYKAEFQEYIQKFEKYDDYILMLEFHEQYDDDWGKGLFLPNAGTAMDPEFNAYMELFRKRGIVKLKAVCEDCGRTMGYRMVPRKLEKAKRDCNTMEGYCHCRCGSRKKWEIRESWVDTTETEINTYNW